MHVPCLDLVTNAAKTNEIVENQPILTQLENLKISVGSTALKKIAPEASFKKLTQNFTLSQIVQQKNFSDADLTTLENVLRKKNWAELAYISHYPELALESLKRKRISIEQFTTLIFYWSLATDYNAQDIHQVFLFNEFDIVNEGVRTLIQRSLTLTVDHKTTLWSLSNAQLDSFFEKMRQKPASEQQFFFIKEIHKEDNYTIINEIFYKLGINLFLKPLFVKNYKQARIVPSLSMMQTFLDVYYNDQAVVITPVIGLSSLESIRQNGWEGTRDFGLAFPGFDLPQEADFIPAPKTIDFYYHDLFHAYVASGIPSLHRQAAMKIESIIENIKPFFSGKIEQTFLSAWQERLIDLEFNKYRKEMRLVDNCDIDEIFWQTISETPEWAIDRMFIFADRNKLNQYESFKKNSFKIYPSKKKLILFLVQKGVYSSFAQQLLNQQQQFESDYKISFKKLSILADKQKYFFLENAAKHSLQTKLDTSLSIHIANFLNSKESI